jgi:hypothetical protein
MAAPPNPTFNAWLLEEVTPKLRVLEEVILKQFGQSAFEAFLASPSNGIAPFIYWSRDHTSTQTEGASTSPVRTSSLSQGPQPQKKTLPADGPGSLRFLAAARGVELYEQDESLPARYKPGRYMETEDFNALNVLMRDNGWRWSPGFKAWVPATLGGV